VGPVGPEAKLAVVLEGTVADDNILAGEGCSAGVGVLEDAVFDRDVIACQQDGALLGAVGRIAKTNSFDCDVAALDREDLVARGRFDHNLVLGDVVVAGRLDIEPLGGKIHKERAPTELVSLEDLAEQIAVDQDLLTAADESMGLLRRGTL